MTRLTVTLGAGATQVSTTPRAVRWVTIQNNAAHLCRVGDQTVTTSVGALLDPSSAGAAGGSLTINAFHQAAIDLSAIWIAGTNADTIDVVYVA